MDRDLRYALFVPGIYVLIARDQRPDARKSMEREAMEPLPVAAAARPQEL